jgi:hypothetical protein
VSAAVQPDAPLVGFGTPDESQALEPFNRHSIAYANSLIVKSGPGVLFGFTAYSSNVAVQFILVFDANTVPADGAIPSVVFTVGATANLGTNWIPGRTFFSGIVLCNSTTGPTKTIGAADTFFDAQYL